jgi:BCL2-associated athanogene 2
MRHLGVPRDGGPGRLPRTTFVDDPFFHHDPFDGFSRDPFPRESGFSRSPQPQRRFGSTPRLIDDEFFDETFGPGMPSAFGSLPRHRHTSRSPRPPTDRGSPSSQTYQQPQPQYPQYPQQQTFQQERSIPVQRASPNNSSSQITPSKKSPIPKGAVEINNAASSYTNGELNPDRKQQQSAPDSPNMSNSNNIEPEIQVKKIRSEQSSPPQKQQQNVERQSSNGNATSEEQQEKKSEAIPLPPPLNGFAAAAEARRTAFNEKKTSIDGGSNNKFIHLLDEAERRIELLREMASNLEQEKEQLLDALNNVRINADFLRLDDHDREDIDATSERLMKRCKAVEVSVFTPRNEDQARALDEVNKLIDAVTQKMQDDLAAAKGTIERYFNACCPDEVGPIDQRFQTKVIECTADDQKKIRRKLAQIIEQIQRAERVCNPPDY